MASTSLRNASCACHEHRNARLSRCIQSLNFERGLRTRRRQCFRQQGWSRLHGMHSSNRNQATLVVAALTESAELPLGTTAPSFELVEPLTQKLVKSSDFTGANALLVIFMCNHCPFVKLLKEGLVELAKDYKDRGVQLVAISSNSVRTHPQDGPEQMAADAKNFGYPFPYIFDEDQEVARAYQAACTPEFFLFDCNLRLQYHGQFDDARPSNNLPVTGKDVRRAIDDLLAGKEPSVKVKPSIGCNIKWHPQAAPSAV